MWRQLQSLLCFSLTRESKLIYVCCMLIIPVMTTHLVHFYLFVFSFCAVKMGEVLIEG